MIASLKGQFVHLGLLAVAAVLALAVWTRNDADLSSKSTEVEVWPGKPESVTALSFESATRKVHLEAKEDALGRFYVGTVDKDEVPLVHGVAGAGGAPPSDAPKHETVRFVAVKAADDLVRSLAPLRALRSVGRVEGSRAEEFGLDKPEGTLRVTLAGKEQTLIIGGTTPGGSDRYAKSASGEVYAISGDVAQNLLYAESRLPERDLQNFKPEEVSTVKLLKAGKSRDLSRIADKNEGWADAKTPTKLDETAGNWMSKLAHLHVQDWVERPSVPVGPENEVVSVAYFSGTKPLGTLDLYRVPGENGTHYLAKSAFGRWYARLVTSGAEQVDQDSASVIK